jgi:hypothetical protein
MNLSSIKVASGITGSRADIFAVQAPMMLLGDRGQANAAFGMNSARISAPLIYDDQLIQVSSKQATYPMALGPVNTAAGHRR